LISLSQMFLTAKTYWFITEPSLFGALLTLYEAPPILWHQVSRHEYPTPEFKYGDHGT